MTFPINDYKPIVIINLVYVCMISLQSPSCLKTSSDGNGGELCNEAVVTPALK